MNREKNSFWIRIATVFIRKSNRFTSNAVISKQRFTRWEEICKRWFARWCTICTDYQTTDFHRFAKEKNEIYKSHLCGSLFQKVMKCQKFRDCSDVNGSKNAEPNRKPSWTEPRTEKFPYKFLILVQKLANRTEPNQKTRKWTEPLTSLSHICFWNS